MIEEKSFQFALKIISVVKTTRFHNEYVFAEQLLNSGTAIGATIAEAGAGQSKNDFIAKMAIASKEAREARYWLKLIKESKVIPDEIKAHLNEIEEIRKIVSKIVKTSKQNLN